MTVRPALPHLLIAGALLATGCDGARDEAPPGPTVLAGEAGAAGIGAGPSAAPCDDPGAEPFVVEFANRVARHGTFARFAEERFGEPRGCRGEVAGSFDGAPYGSVELDYGDGAATLTVRTMPPETSITTLRLRDGFAGTDEARALLERHAERVGLAMDWSRPQSMTVDGRTTVEFVSAEELNAFARISGPAPRVDTVSVSLAL